MKSKYEVMFLSKTFTFLYSL